MDHQKPRRNRIVLLFDLDCFYAQCERVRLGLDLDTNLALLQWNSVLAVTYPARERYGIKRGDTWDSITTKCKNSSEKCWTIHLRILEKDGGKEEQQVATDDQVQPQQLQLQKLQQEKQASSQVMTAKTTAADGNSTVTTEFTTNNNDNGAIIDTSTTTIHVNEEASAQESVPLPQCF